MQKNKLAATVSKPLNKSKQLAVFQNASDIINALRVAEYDSRAVSKDLAVQFNEDDKKKVAAKVWYFLRTQIPYFAEPKNAQTAQTINRFLHDAAYKNGSGDCKHFATFAVGVLNACGIKTWFTFAGQNKYIKKPNHAYATCLIDGKEIVIDACRKRFNDECEYFYKWNVNRL